ncbi:hypothetical protein AWJ20_1384 [Sugiyamaella lignohabitans]|uniref:RING-type domain-containing protein n=1 Tax=Sugiyamaella lignohabitans TaxID=796027 RepID=A0A167DNG9_9ASCO|nr:uncharacterized protein AWJ20_1384 [Sugiyamaella lignohabitans]ANB13104.1 hypothetical protein AWJ20_1384 [Sugiyamaella lignohabitans]
MAETAITDSEHIVLSDGEEEESGIQLGVSVGENGGDDDDVQMISVSTAGQISTAAEDVNHLVYQSAPSENAPHQQRHHHACRIHRVRRIRRVSRIDDDDVQITGIFSRPPRHQSASNPTMSTEEARRERQRRELHLHEERQRYLESIRVRREREFLRFRRMAARYRARQESARLRDEASWEGPSQHRRLMPFRDYMLFGNEPDIEFGPDGQMINAYADPNGGNSLWSNDGREIGYFTPYYMNRGARRNMETLINRPYGALSNEEERLFQAVLQRSIEDTGEVSHRPTVDQLRKPEIPKSARPGYSRAVEPELDVVCARCETELGVGLTSDMKLDKGKEQETSQEASDLVITEADRLLSKRVFFARCGHVYCGRCVNATVNRRNNKKRKGKKGPDPTRKCSVPDCGQSFSRVKKPFSEIYY